MKIINKSGVPEIVFKYLEHDFYDGKKGDPKVISATTLLKPVQEILLTTRHYDEIEVDAIDRMWAMFGSGIHAILEHSKLSDMQEQRIKVDIDGVTLSGKFDLIYGGHMTDFKVTSAWTLVYDSRKDEWTKQLSIYRWLYWKETGKLTTESAIKLSDEAYVIAILRDWDAKRVSGKYPELPIVQIPLNLLSIEKTEEGIKSKLKLIKEAGSKMDGQLPPCTDEQRWWNEKAKKYNKCEKYCLAYPFCHQVRRDKR